MNISVFLYLIYWLVVAGILVKSYHINKILPWKKKRVIQKILVYPMMVTLTDNKIVINVYYILKMFMHLNLQLKGNHT